MIAQSQTRMNIFFNHVWFHQTTKNKLNTDEKKRNS